MKKTVIIFLFLTTAIYAQDNKYEKIKALKVAYITEQLALTSSEAQKFWPVYNEFDEKFHKLRHKKRDEVYDKLQVGNSNLSEKDANNLIDDYLSLETEELNLQKQKVEALRKVISAKKIIGLRKAEDDFKRKLLERYRRGKERRSPKGKNRP